MSNYRSLFISSILLLSTCPSWAGKISDAGAKAEQLAGDGKYIEALPSLGNG